MDALSNLFSQKPSARKRESWWVSKSDVASYERCPWAFWLVDSGGLCPSAILDVVAVRRFLEEGIAFESTVRSSAQTMTLGALPTLAKHGHAIVLGVPTVENPELGLFGKPDGVCTARGAMLPVEVKSHGSVRRLDEIELCFYWELLQPWRTLTARPAGLLVVPNGDEGFRLIDVNLTDERFVEMHELVEAVRRVRRQPPKARVCRCVVCSKLQAQRVFEECRARGDLTLVSGIGRRYAPVLEAAGISDLSTLRKQLAPDVVDVLREAGYHVPQGDVLGWIHHAAALTDDKPVVFGVDPFGYTEFIALDLEYDTWEAGTPIWLAGAEVVRGGRRHPYSCWADPGEEPALLEGLARLLEAHPRLPVVTWSGHSADMPTLKKACSRWRRDDLYEEVSDRHVDLYLYVKSSVRFPVKGLGLKLVAAQLGLVADPSLSDGLDATSAWQHYCKNPRTEEAANLRQELMRYNSSDVTGLVDVAIRVRELTTGVRWRFPS
jgi:predicted RecB family nuclease